MPYSLSSSEFSLLLPLAKRFSLAPASNQILLRPKEFELLMLFMRNPGRVYTRDIILDQLWGHDYIGDTRTVDVHVRWLRQKVEPNPSEPQHLMTIRGVGYRFDA